jgi:hypothetical protein
VNGQKNIGFVESFKYFAGAEYPDGASVETWNDGPGTISRGTFDQTLENDPRKTPYFLESELLSPYATLAPGEEYRFPVYWAPTRIPNPVRDPSSAGAVSEPLSAHIQHGTAALKGVFGVFSPGTLEATFYSLFGEELSHINLQPVDPREVVRLEKSVPVPANAFRVSILVRDPDGENRGFLGNVVLR